MGCKTAVGLHGPVIPTAPTSGQAIQVDQFPAVVGDMFCVASEMAFGLIDLVALGDLLEEKFRCVEVRANLITGCISLPLKNPIGRVVPLGCFPSQTIVCLVIDFPFGPHGAGDEPRHGRHRFQPA